VPSTARTRGSAATRFALLCALSVVAGWHPLLSVFVLATRADEYTHLLLIVPISAALIFSERADLNGVFPPDLRLGPALLAAGILIAAYSRVS